MIHFIFSLVRRMPPYLFTIIVVMVILYLTLWPDPLPDNEIYLFPHADKVVHFLMFGGLTGIACIDTSVWCRSTLSLRAVRAICAMAIVLGGIIELLQGAMGNGRSADWVDLAADAAGAVTGAFIAYFLIRKEGRDASQSQS